MTNRYNGEVAFPPMEGKAVLRLSTAAFAALDEKFHRDYRAETAQDEPRPPFLRWLQQQAVEQRPRVLQEVFRLAIREPGSDKVPAGIDIDSPPPIVEIHGPVCDAIWLAVTGETLTAIAERLRQETAAAVEAENQPVPPESPTI